jgi:type VI secretion system secreted protein Hcp
MSAFKPPVLDKNLTGGAPGSNFELHLNLGTIQGESQSTLHNAEIELKSFTFGSSSPTLRNQAGSTKGGRATVTEISVTKEFDKATPQIFNALWTNQVIKSAVISMTKMTGSTKGDDTLVITLTNCSISSISVISSKSAPDAHGGTETVSLNFQKIQIDYKVQLASGLLAAAGSASYDMTAGS